MEVPFTCVTLLAGLFMVLRFLERRDARLAVRLTESAEKELRATHEDLKGRVSKLEMARLTR
jgi:hypothetical protein